MTTTMTNTTMGIQKISLNALEKEKMSDYLTRQTVYGEKATVAKLFAKRGGLAERHSHPSEEFSLVTSGTLKFIFDDRELVANAGELVVIPPNVPHGVVALEDAEFIDFFAPAREDWLRGEDTYLRK